MSAQSAPGEGKGSRSLRIGGGGGSSDGMDARVARLEAHVETLRSDVADLRAAVAALTERVAVLAERVAHLPTKGFVVSTNLTAIAFLSGLILYGEKLKALAGL